MAYQPTEDDIKNFSPIMEMWGKKFEAMSKEVQAKKMARMEECKADPAKKAIEDKNFAEDFAVADADKDGRVNRAEFQVLMDMTQKRELERDGEVEDFGQADWDLCYNVQNALSADEGISMDEFEKSECIFLKIMESMS